VSRARYRDVRESALLGALVIANRSFELQFFIDKLLSRFDRRPREVRQIERVASKLPR
jgi:hypothetical protein